MLRITGHAVGLFSFSGFQSDATRSDCDFREGMFTHGIYENANCERTYTMQAQASSLAMYGWDSIQRRVLKLPREAINLRSISGA